LSYTRATHSVLILLPFADAFRKDFATNGPCNRIHPGLQELFHSHDVIQYHRAALGIYR